MAIALFWDIDGTLLTTKRAGVFALEEACEAVIGHSVDLQSLKTAGLTDVEIARLIIQTGGLDPQEDNVKAFIRHYEDRLPHVLHRRDGHTLENVIPILHALKERREFFSVLLTGNTYRGAQAKLTYFKLSKFFNFEDSAFSDDTQTREDIALLARDRAVKAHGDDIQAMYVIGDTPHDVRCAKAIEAPCIAVATGGYTESQLKESGAWKVFPHLPEPEVFLELVSG